MIMKGRVKKVTTTYYNLNGDVDHSEVVYFTQIKYPIIGWVTGSFGWNCFETAKEKVIEKLGKRSEKVEYIDV